MNIDAPLEVEEGGARRRVTLADLQGQQGLPGAPGAPGADGADGQSAYQAWLAAGNVGTEADFLAALRGAKGDKGDTGAPGADGVDGVDGAPGAVGRSAYQVWLDAGNVGTVDDYLAALKGAAGADGADGKSAYQVWLDAGNVGDVNTYLASLKGAKGDTGATGAAGPDNVIVGKAVPALGAAQDGYGWTYNHAASAMVWTRQASKAELDAVRQRRRWLAGAGQTIAGAAAAGTYIAFTNLSNVASGGASSALGLIYLDPADFTAGDKLMVETVLVTNAVAPSITFTAGLYAVSAFGGASGAAPTITVGAPVATNAFVAPGASTHPRSVSAQVAVPAAGFYCFATATSAVNTTNASVTLLHRLLAVNP